MSSVITANYQHFVEDLIQKSNIKDSDLFKNQRLSALNEFQKKGFPTLKQENWKYTPVQPLLNIQLNETTGETLAKHPLTAKFKYVLMIENGRINFDESNLPEEIMVMPVDEYLNQQPETGFEINAQHPFLLLNHACFTGGFCIQIPKNTIIDSGVLVVQSFNGNSGNIHHHKNIIVAENSSEIEITDVIYSNDQTELFINLHSLFFVKTNAKLRFSHINDLGNRSRNVQFSKANLYQNSGFTHDNFQINNFYSRNDIQLYLHESGSEGNLNGIFLGKDNQLIDNHTVVEHIAAHCQSNETYKGILKDAATGVFNGRIHVHRDAQKTNAYQQNKNILLSKQATINTKPELEIYADDVKCSHGSTTGMFDEKAVFYLQSRAIGEQTAKLMLTKAFAGDVLNSISDENVQHYIEAKIDNTLSK